MLILTYFKLTVMRTLSRLSAGALEYYINVRRWKTDLDFINTEIIFLQQLVDDLKVLMPNLAPVLTDPTGIVKLSNIIKDKNRVAKLLEVQLTELEQLADNLLTEDKQTLVGKKAHLNYQVSDLIHEFRETKRTLFGLVEEALEKQKQYVKIRDRFQEAD